MFQGMLQLLFLSMMVVKATAWFPGLDKINDKMTVCQGNEWYENNADVTVHRQPPQQVTITLNGTTYIDGQSFQGM